MRSYHDDEGARHPHPATDHHPDAVEGATGRALQAGRSDTLTRGAVAHLQRAAGNAGVSSLLAPEEEQASPVLDVVGSGGSALDPATRSEMEARLGHDFSDVRVHTDTKASESAKSVQASAYTVGNDVVFGSGAYAPGTDAGKRTLAHELTHVVQQRSGPVDGTPTGEGVSISNPSDRFEQAAERSADSVMSGARADSEPAAAIQREAAADELAGGEPTVQRQGLAEEEQLKYPSQA